MELSRSYDLNKEDLLRNQSETHQLLEAAEHLEYENNSNRERVDQLEADLGDAIDTRD